MDDEAGISLLKKIREESEDIPLLMLSSEEKNRREEKDGREKNRG